MQPHSEDQNKNTLKAAPLLKKNREGENKLVRTHFVSVEAEYIPSQHSVDM